MSALNLSQVQIRLNELFVTYGERKLVFWFDPKKEFEEDIDNGQIELQEAKIYKLEPHTQFKAKRFFEIEDRDHSYLIYAPFKKLNEDDENNHLLSILKYSNIFNADRISLVSEQFNIPSDLHDMVESYSKFFESKVRNAAFEKLSTIVIKTNEEFELRLMAVITKANTAQLYSIVQSLFVENANGVSVTYDQLAIFDLQEVFWKYIFKYYGYYSDEPTIQKLRISFFSNAFYGRLGYQELPSDLKKYEVIEQTTAIVSFIDGFMNDARYTETFDKLSFDTYNLINGDKLLDKMSIEEMIEADIFEPIHVRIIKYFIGQFLNGDMTSTISGDSLQDIVKKKSHSHFGDKYIHHYEAILNAQYLLNHSVKRSVNQFSTVVKDYQESSYLVDKSYRKFIFHLDQICISDDFVGLQKLVEKRYKLFLNEIGRLWNDLFDINARTSMLDFYDKFATSRTKTVVIISDALRYEAAKEVQEILEKDKKYSTKMDTIFSVLPSVTEFGKAASLRSGLESYEYIEGNDVRVNDMKTQSTSARDKILKEKNPNSLAISFDEVMQKSNAKELREVFNGQELIYLYHDQIDKTGDHGNESQVFDAVERAVNDLKTLLTFVSNGANVYRFIITSDHGFIYTRSNVEEHDKIENPSKNKENDRIERRFIISKNDYNEIGIGSMKLCGVLRNEDSRYINFPETSAIFKKAGGGQKYVHGGSSPQEMLVPVLEVRVARGSSQKKEAAIQLMTSKRKVIGFSITLEFYQTEAVSDSVTKSQYSLYFEDEKGGRITNEHTYYVDSSSVASSDRFTNFTFEFINRKYEVNEKVYLVVKNWKNKVKIKRINFVIDNPFSRGLRFDI